MSVDQRASAAHSHLPESHRNKGRSEVVRMGDITTRNEHVEKCVQQAGKRCRYERDLK